MRTNLFVIEELARRLGVAHKAGFGMSERDLIATVLRPGELEQLDGEKWIDRKIPFEEAHFLNGFGHADGKFHFRPDWTGQKASTRPPENVGILGPAAQLPAFPDYCPVIEETDEAHPFRLATSPARNFLNSSFAETKTSREKERRPEVMINPADATPLGIESGDIVRLGNTRGDLRLHARVTPEARTGVLIAEGLWPNKAHLDGEGINVLTGADSVAPYGGAGLHDNKVWLVKA